MAPSPATETTTLLPKSPHDESKPQKWSPTFTIALMMVVVGLANLGDGIMSPSQTRISENIICYKHWEQHDPSKLTLPRHQVGPGALGGVAEEFCKVASIQSELALIKGWQIFFENIPGLLLGVAVGALADRTGRKPIIVAGFFALTLRMSWIAVVFYFWQTLPLRLTWLSAIYAFVGGGAPVISAICLCVISDVTSPSNRTTHLYRVAAVAMVAGYGGPAISAAIMVKFDPWVALMISLSLWMLSFVLTPFLPETLNYSHPSLEHAPMQPVIHQDPADLLVDPGEHTAQLVPKGRMMTQIYRNGITAVTENTTFLVSDGRILLLLMPYIGLMINEAARELVMLYASVRYHIIIADATLLTAVGAMSKFVALVLILPCVATLLSRAIPGLAPFNRDMILARTSFLLLCCGWLLTGLAPNQGLFVLSLVLAALGVGANSLVRSILTDIVGKHNAGKLYSIISILECLTLILAGPILSSLYSVAIRVGGILIGLPFFFIAAVYVLTLIALTLVRAKKNEVEAIQDEEANNDEHRALLDGENH